MNIRRAALLSIIIIGGIAIVILLGNIFKEIQLLTTNQQQAVSSPFIAVTQETATPLVGNIASTDDAFAPAKQLFAENCIACHGAAGQGSAIAPPLNTAALRQTDNESLQTTITFGRPETAMPAWGSKAGGPLSAEQIGQLAALIRAGAWEQMPQAVKLPNRPEINVADSFEGVSSQALSLFAQNCSGCHGSTGQGSVIAPPLNSAELRARLTNDAIAATISNGRPGTQMPTWGGILSQNDIASLVTLIRHWDSLSGEQLAQLAQQSSSNRFGGMGGMMGSGGMMGGGMMGGRGNRQ